MARNRTDASELKVALLTALDMTAISAISKFILWKLEFIVEAGRFGSGQSSVVRFCEHGNEISLPIKLKEYFQWLSVCYALKKVSVSWNCIIFRA
jgi:hypothetical protein